MADSFFGDLTTPKASTGQPAGGGSFFGDLAPQKAPGAFKGATGADIARDVAAHPTKFEQESKERGDSATPIRDIAKGLGESVLSTVAPVSSAINKIPYIGARLAPSAGIQSMKQLGTPVTAGEKLGSEEGNVIQSALAAPGISKVGEAALPVLKPILGPVARYAEENVVPMLKHVPVVGRAWETAESAPTIVKAAVRGATGGAAAGAAPGAIHMNPEEAAEGALYGAGIGGLAGVGAHGLKRIAGEVPKAIPSVMSEEPFALKQEIAQREVPVQQTLGLPKPEAAPAGAIPKISANPITRMGDLIEQGAGTKPLQPGVPLREQVNYGGKPTFRREPLVNRVGDLEGGAGRNVAPEKIPQVISNEIGKQMGAELTPEEIEKQRLQLKYPDRAERQQVHINGEQMHQAAKDNPEMYDAVTKLKNSDVRQAMINSGENMVREDGSPIMVNNRKLEGKTGDITRQEAFNRLLAKGHSPEKIVDLAKSAAQNAPKPALKHASESESGKTGTNN